jgi:lysophospholipase L1-like esterase
VLGAWLLLGAGPAIAGPINTYIALGDSVAFGQTNVLPTSYGDQGYVKPFADWLGEHQGGVRPQVINLAIPGEVTTSFFTGVPPAGWTRNVDANLNYAQHRVSQDDLFLSTVAAEQAAGHRIRYVTFALGANDLFALTSDPNFFKRPDAQWEKDLNQMLVTMRANYIKTLTQIRKVLPDATLLLLDYYNPFAALGSDSPANRLVQNFVDAHHLFLTEDAPSFGARVVSIGAPFVGHEGDYTYIFSGNVHPNDHGYQVIADQLIAAVDSPEPGTLTLLALGAVGLAGYGWQRRSRP